MSPSLSQLIAQKRTEILGLAERHGARRIRVFGSCARGEARPDSDLDLLVDMGPDCSLLDQIALAQDLEDVLGRRIDLVSERGLHPAIREAVLRDARPI